MAQRLEALCGSERGSSSEQRTYKRLRNWRVHCLFPCLALVSPFSWATKATKAQLKMAGVTPSFQFQVPPASEDTKAPGLLASMAPGGFMDAQKEVSRHCWPIRMEPNAGACLRSSPVAVAAWRRCSCVRLSRRRMRALLASHALLHSPSLCPCALCRASARVPCARRVYQAQQGQRNLAEQLKDGLTPYQISLLEKVRRANTDPIIKHPRKSERTAALQVTLAHTWLGLGLGPPPLSPPPSPPPPSLPPSPAPSL